MPTEAEVAFERGKAHFEAKRNSEAEQEFVRAVQLAPQSGLYRAWLSRAYGRLDKTAAAAEEAQKAIDLDPACAVAHVARGNAFSDKGDPDRAIADYTEAIRLDPKYALAYYNRGNAFSDKGDNDRAIADYTEAIRLDPKYAAAYYNRGIAFRAKGDIKSYIADRARYNSLQDKQGAYFYNDKDPQWIWAGKMMAHTANEWLMPRIRSGGERFVDYWPCDINWGMERWFGVYQGTSTHSYGGKYGMGILAVTDKSLHLYSIGEVSRRLRRGSSLLTKGLLALFRGYDFTSVEKEDRSWVVPWPSLSGVRRDGDAVAIRSAGEEWLL